MIRQKEDIAANFKMTRESCSCAKLVPVGVSRRHHLAEENRTTRARPQHKEAKTMSVANAVRSNTKLESVA